MSIHQRYPILINFGQRRAASGGARCSGGDESSEGGSSGRGGEPGPFCALGVHNQCYSNSQARIKIFSLLSSPKLL